MRGVENLFPQLKRPKHIPVLCNEIVQILNPKSGEIFIDGTFGAGGHSLALLQSANCRVLAFDRDPTTITSGREILEKFSPRISLLHRPFSELQTAVEDLGLHSVDGVLLDVGLSSMQIDEPLRGFSFQQDGPLDMRMSGEGQTASEAINSFAEERLADLIFTLGEEPHARRIARAIARRREKKPFTNTKELADLVVRVVGGQKSGRIHPATKTFQALRIFLNDELIELKNGLYAAERVLKPGGRLAVISFHSLEDRIVKRFLQERSGKVYSGSRYVPDLARRFSAPSFRIINPRPFTPSKNECEVNPRARTARMRAAVRTEAPIWQDSKELE